VFGRWEADLLIFRGETGKANVTSLVERKSRFTFLLANEDKRSAAVIAGVAEALRGLPEDARRTVTFDRGTEFAAYPELARELDVASYFCDPHSPWRNDRVRRQACFQAVPVRSMALSVTTSLRMQAVSASLAGFPARRSRS
jgi:transposase, IS30 family